MTTLTTKAEYLQAVRDWKDAYRTLTQEQRQAKRALREAQRKQAGYLEISDLTCAVWRNRAHATAMLEERATMKAAAQAAYLAQHAQN